MDGLVLICTRCGLPERLRGIKVEAHGIFPVCPERKIVVVEVYRKREEGDYTQWRISE